MKGYIAYYKKSLSTAHSDVSTRAVKHTLFYEIQSLNGFLFDKIKQNLLFRNVLEFSDAFLFIIEFKLVKHILVHYIDQLFNDLQMNVLFIIVRNKNQIPCFGINVKTLLEYLKGISVFAHGKTSNFINISTIANFISIFAKRFPRNLKVHHQMEDKYHLDVELSLQQPVEDTYEVFLKNLFNANSYKQKLTVVDTVSNPATNITKAFATICVSVNFSKTKFFKF
ncbi:hypothetical protein AGLY_008259 [Aphis glycines]|uniref:Uncharacterized protein n=1 Tax=Aphis glycines TaxID=307491 RepID=A0A6G0TLW5_APHGL|nr:hypothetical protein AGLY_008259 [Aphis glycines]